MSSLEASWNLESSFPGHQRSTALPGPWGQTLVSVGRLLMGLSVLPSPSHLIPRLSYRHPNPGAQAAGTHSASLETLPPWRKPGQRWTTSMSQSTLIRGYEDGPALRARADPAQAPGSLPSFHRCGSSQPSVPSVPGEPTPSCGLHRHCMHVANTDGHSGKTPIHIQENR